MIKKFIKTIQNEDSNSAIQVSKEVNLEQLWRSIHLQIEDFNTRRCASKQAKQKLKQQIEATNENNEKLNQSIKQYKQEHQFYKQKYESSLANLEDQQQAMRLLEDENHKCKKEKSMLLNEKNSEIQMAKQMRDALQVENKELKEQHKNANQQIKTLQMEYQYVSDKVAEAISKLSECIAEKIRSQKLNPY